MLNRRWWSGLGLGLGLALVLGVAPLAGGEDESTLRGSLDEVKVGDWARYDAESRMGEGRRNFVNGRFTVTVTEKTETEIVLRIDRQHLRMFTRRGGEGGVNKTSSEVRVQRGQAWDFKALLPELLAGEGVEITDGESGDSELLAAGQTFACRVTDAVWTAPARERPPRGDKDNGKDKDRPKGDKDKKGPKNGGKGPDGREGGPGGPGGPGRPPFMPAEGEYKVWTSEAFPFGLIQWEVSYEMSRGERKAKMVNTLRLMASGDLEHPDPKADEELEAPERRDPPGGGDREAGEGRGRGGPRGEGPRGGGRPPR